VVAWALAETNTDAIRSNDARRREELITYLIVTDVLLPLSRLNPAYTDARVAQYTEGSSATIISTCPSADVE
jgi:hypothetical protein